MILLHNAKLVLALDNQARQIMCGDIGPVLSLFTPRGSSPSHPIRGELAEPNVHAV